MTAEEIRARYVEVIEQHATQPNCDGLTECACGRLFPTWRGWSSHLADALTAAGLLPDGEEWAVRYEARRATPSMEGKTFDTSTLTVDGEGHARAAIANGVPMSGLNRRIVSRPAFEWREVSVDE
ncbi:hypothetical protein [Nocardia aurea]|uniref:hypothetical protein n=1 Tax=Nocardia aurea TaxID=2144174 RepID=UPI0033A5484E